VATIGTVLVAALTASVMRGPIAGIGEVAGDESVVQRVASKLARTALGQKQPARG
jgi:hypothetical protein